MIKRFLYIFILSISAVNLSGCSTNPATGESQFTALMSPDQELEVGAQEHSKIIKQFGVYNDTNLQNFLSQTGQKVSRYTERPEVEYKFFLLDSPMVNAFALPGGYIYMTRGLMALANSEAEVASVLAHETGHITARHSAERYSRGVVTSIGAMILSTAIGHSGVSQALGIGSDLYIKSYSRDQENQADTLGIRYLSRSGYTPSAMSWFLQNLQAETSLQAAIDGKSSQGATYFSTHPATAERVNKTVVEAKAYAQQGVVNREEYLKLIDGMTYGDSAEQGFVRDQSFYHPVLGFQFSVPSGYKIMNQPSQVIAAAKDGSVIIFDLAPNKDGFSPMKFMKDVWMKGEPISGEENIVINGMNAATSSFKGSVNGKTMNLRIIAIQWSDNQIARFQVALPLNMSAQALNAVKSSTYSFKRMTAQDKANIRPYRIRVVMSKQGDTVSTLAARMAQKDFQERRFRVLNGLGPQEQIVANRMYKIVSY